MSLTCRMEAYLPSGEQYLEEVVEKFWIDLGFRV